jgi:hypothetical protein
MFGLGCKILVGGLLVMGWLGCLTTSLKLLSAPSDLGVVLGWVSLVVSSFVALWLLKLLFHPIKRGENEDESEDGVGPGAAGFGGSGH